MSVAKKRKLLEKFCDFKNDCKGCILEKRGVIFRGCYNSGVPDEIINENYDLVFNVNGFKVDELLDDPVNRPSHYTDGKIEVIDYIEDKKLGFCLGNAIKYISRAGKKDPSKEIEDLDKAIWYIKRRIKEIQEARL